MWTTREIGNAAELELEESLVVPRRLLRWRGGIIKIQGKRVTHDLDRELDCVRILSLARGFQPRQPPGRYGSLPVPVIAAAYAAMRWLDR